MSAIAEVTAAETYQALQSDRDAVLVDCRTRPEWQFVGVPVADRVVFVEWSTYPAGHNERFVDELSAAGVDPDHAVYFLCRSGQRSRAAAAAAAAAGYRRVFNVGDGFEGPLDDSARRVVAGWKASGLPWRQS